MAKSQKSIRMKAAAAPKPMRLSTRESLADRKEAAQIELIEAQVKETLAHAEERIAYAEMNRAQAEKDREETKQLRRQR
ncbi:MAG TPA: hypothetical protein VGY55_11710 [Pirellulales bacterium]|jgi:hypothetical protein|nr:hypothetical protein [Pirellulales bacterium]